MRFDVHPTTMKQKQGAPLRTHPEKSTYDRDMYNRAFPVGNALFLFAGGVMSLPAACAPETAGEAVAQTVCDMIGQREEAS